MPGTIRTVLALLAATGATAIARAVVDFVEASAPGNATGLPASFWLFVGFVGVAFSLLAAWLTLRGALFAPYLVTLIGARGITEFADEMDLLALVTIAVGAVMTVLVWLPRSRAFLKAAKAARMQRAQFDSRMN